MAVMIVKEQSESEEREFELREQHLRRMMALTGLDEAAIYTMLSSGRPLEHGQYRWIMVRQ